MVDAHAAPTDVTSYEAARARVARVNRGLLAATFSTFVALVSHVLAGGAVPGVAGIATPVIFATSACALLAELRFSWLRLSVSVAVSQVLFHTLFVVGTAPSGTVSVTGGVGGATSHAGHGGHPTMTIVGASGDAMSHAGHSGGWMWLAHVAAAAVTVVALQRGEVVLSRLKASIEQIVVLFVPPVACLLHVPVQRRPMVADARGVWVPLRRSVVSSGTVRRGPPAASLA